jgi:hypothetical protein
MAQHHDAIAARPIFVGGEGATEDRPDAHHVEVVRGHARADDPFRRGLVGQVVARVVERGQALLEIRNRRVDVHVVAHRHHLGCAFPDFADQHQARGFPERERLQDHGVDRAEDGRRRANAQRQRQQCHGGKPGILEELPRREREVLSKFTEILCAFHMPVSPCAESAQCDPRPFDVAGATLRLAPRRHRIHAALDEIAHAHLEVKRQFVVDFVGDGWSPEHAVKGVHGSRFKVQGSFRVPSSWFMGS